jgi:hypothetical protein
MNFVTNGLCVFLLLIIALGSSTPSFAQAPDASPGTSQEPGSVIVFPEFIKGTVAVDGTTQAQTEITVGALCPREATCPEQEQVRIGFRWICPGSQDIASLYVCKETGFEITLPVNGKITFNPENLPLPGNTRVSGPPCPQGYLIGWVIDSARRPIKYDGLIGHALLRDGSPATESYEAIQIPAEPNLATRAGIATGVDPRTGARTVVFDGGAGHYQLVGGQVVTDVKNRNSAYHVSLRNPSLTLATLDVRSNRPNYPTFVNLNFYNEAELRISTSSEFLCWGKVQPSDQEVRLSGTHTRQGIAVSGQAVKMPFGGISDIPGPVTLFGLVHATGGSASASMGRAYIFNMLDNSNPIPTVFLPSD